MNNLIGHIRNWSRSSRNRRDDDVAVVLPPAMGLIDTELIKNYAGKVFTKKITLMESEQQARDHHEGVANTVSGKLRLSKIDRERDLNRELTSLTDNFANDLIESNDDVYIKSTAPAWRRWASVGSVVILILGGLLGVFFASMLPVSHAQIDIFQPKFAINSYTETNSPFFKTFLLVLFTIFYLAIFRFLYKINPIFAGIYLLMTTGALLFCFTLIVVIGLLGEFHIQAPGVPGTFATEIARYVSEIKHLMPYAPELNKFLNFIANFLLASTTGAALVSFQLSPPFEWRPFRTRGVSSNDKNLNDYQKQRADLKARLAECRREIAWIEEQKDQYARDVGEQAVLCLRAKVNKFRFLELTPQ